jgi:hypothetical protein
MQSSGQLLAGSWQMQLQMNGKKRSRQQMLCNLSSAITYLHTAYLPAVQ